MNRFARTTSIAVGVAIGWGVAVALISEAYRDPLIGYGLPGYIGYVGFHALLAGLIVVAFGQHLRWFGSLLIFLELFLAMPLPSKRGVDAKVSNVSSIPAQVTIRRRDKTERSVSFSVLPGQLFSYRTAPGKYSEAMPLLIEHGTLRLSVTVADLRRHQVQLTGSEVLLRETDANKPQ